MSFIKAEITRDEMEDFRKLTESMPDSDKSFAISLASQFEKHGLSTKQVYWVRTLMERYLDRAGTTGSMTPKKKTYGVTNIGAVGQIFEMFAKARQKHMQNPIIRIVVDGNKLKLSQAGTNPIINIVEFKGTEGRIWYGALNLDGMLSLTERCKFPEALIQTLKEFAADPSKASGVMGKRMRACCFCGIGLTTTDSLYYGYGPICADNFGLEWGQAKSHMKAEMVSDAVQEIQNVKLF